jgi:Gluconate 2-dehydrogenase subunit 3
MERRELLKNIALLTGGVFIGGELFLSGCKSGAKLEAGFTPATISLLDEVAETIIPATKTPGAKAAQVGEFMKIFVTDCYTESNQKVFTNGIIQLDEACNKMQKKSFMDCDAQQRKDFLISLEKEAKAFNEPINKENEGKKDENKKPLHYYTMMKQLTLLGFFTSKTGATETLRHIAVPGKYDGAFPYKKGDRAWAES